MSATRKRKRRPPHRIVVLIYWWRNYAWAIQWNGRVIASDPPQIGAVRRARTGLVYLGKSINLPSQIRIKARRTGRFRTEWTYVGDPVRYPS